MRKLAETHRAGHPRAALERVQRAPKLLRRLLVARIAPPHAHVLARLRVELGGLFEKYLQNLCVDVVANAGQRIGRFLRDALGLRPCGRWYFDRTGRARRFAFRDGRLQLVVARRGFRGNGLRIDVSATHNVDAQRLELVRDRLRIEAIAVVECGARADAIDQARVPLDRMRENRLRRARQRSASVR